MNRESFFQNRCYNCHPYIKQKAEELFNLYQERRSRKLKDKHDKAAIRKAFKVALAGLYLGGAYDDHGSFVRISLNNNNYYGQSRLSPVFRPELLKVFRWLVTTQSPHEVWVAVGQKARSPNIEHPPLHVVRTKGVASDLKKSLKINLIEDQRNIKYTGGQRIQLVVCDKNSGTFDDAPDNAKFNVMYVLHNGKCVMDVLIDYEMKGRRREYGVKRICELTVHRFEDGSWVVDLAKITEFLRKQRYKNIS